jgi:uncharacterized membrane protein YhhN
VGSPVGRCTAGRVRTMEVTDTTRRAWPWLAVYAGVSVLHLALLAAGPTWAALATKPLLLPLLLAWFVRATPRGWWRATVGTGLLLSWVGDVALMGTRDPWFLVGLGAFLAAQVAYAIGFTRDLHRSIVRRRPLLVVPYVAGVVSLVVWLAPDLGDLLVPVAVYAATIGVMAVLATGVSPVVAVGALLFVASDALLAATSVAGRLDLPVSGMWVMSTYLAGQALIAIGVAARARPTTSAASVSGTV